MSSPLPGPSGLNSRAATASLSQAKATVAVPPESENPQRQQEGRSSPFSALSESRHQVIRPILFRPQAASTVSVSTERQSQQTSYTQQRDIRNPVLGHSDVRDTILIFNIGRDLLVKDLHPYFYPGTGSFVA